jgi:hypothetical protein
MQSGICGSLGHWCSGSGKAEFLGYNTSVTESIPGRLASVFYTKDLMAGYLTNLQPKIADYFWATELEASDPEEVFARLNRGSGREDWAALGKNRSMSVGDVVEIGGVYHMCRSLGFEEVVDTDLVAGLGRLKEVWKHGL